MVENAVRIAWPECHLD